MFFFIVPNNVYAFDTLEDFSFHNNYGVPGLVEIPSYGSFNDGQLSFSTSKHSSHFRNTLSFQALPFVIGSFRYSGIGDAEDANQESTGYILWDRSFDLRLDLLKEKKFIPGLTVGAQDVIGTGTYSGEYLVSSKRVLNNFRITSGLGWGRLGTGNIIIKGNGSRAARDGGDFGGLLRTKSLFKGDVGLFGGIEYFTKNNKLNINAEVSSDTYSHETKKNLIKNTYASKINLGLNYKLNESIGLGTYFIKNKEVGFKVSLSANPKLEKIPNSLEGVPQSFYSFPFPVKNHDKSYWEPLIKDLGKEKVNVVAHKETENAAEIVIENNHYMFHSQAIGRSLRVLSKYIPKTKIFFKIILSKNSIPISEFSFNRNKIEEIIDSPNAELLTKMIVKSRSAPKQIRGMITNKNFINKPSYSISPYYRLHLFDPGHPLYYDLGFSTNFLYQLKPGFIFSGRLETSALTDFDKIWRGEKGSLAKVRTDLKEYLNETDTRIENMILSSYFKLNKNLYGRSSFGYLEPMFGGLSMELLHLRSNSNLAIGAEINHVKKRDYRQLLEFRELKGLAKTNGHLSLYWDTNYEYYKSQIDLGKYLAGDKGVTIKLSRDFPNGYQVGGFFTLTDASFSDFGEGSFDKGIFFRIPFNTILPYETRYGVTEVIRPIQGDGGARIGVRGRLYETIFDENSNTVKKKWNRIWR